ncbi:hypothetical protein R1flu_013751 [Riccia fluitans]|uniref:DNA-directed RNA polymerase RBP11-like dimerisation domain-containing protein n=1 Tax=Riccia fluitans TaxID=41844 RepID=A0ABD1YEW8_9MARC
MSSSICILANFVWLCYLYYVYFASLKDTQLHRDPSVLFAGYRLPHPLQYKLVIKIQTTSQPSPMQEYNLAVNDLDKELDHLKQVFQSKLSARRRTIFSHSLDRNSDDRTAETRLHGFRVDLRWTQSVRTKNRPMEVTSKKPVGRFREVIQAPKRFMSTTEIMG